MGISYHSCIGRNVDVLPSLPCKTTGNTSLNSPVGNCVDRCGNVWLADTAHNRVLVFDSELEQILGAFGSVGDGPEQFNMPFRVISHPEKNWIYVTDIGNFRIHILEYDSNTHPISIRSIRTFGQGDPVNLKGPNGIVIHGNELCVADEFYEGDDGSSRLVVFSDEGEYLRSIHTISAGEGEKPISLLWPQGLSIDKQGHIYIANTGCGSIVRCNWQGEGIPFEATGTPCLTSIALARDVSCVQDRMLIPGGEENAIPVYDLKGRRQGVLEGFFAPIQVSEVPGSNRLLITEPILATLQVYDLKLNTIKRGAQSQLKPILEAGDPRDNPGQLHFVTATAGLLSTTPRAPYQPTPFQQWVDQQQALQDNIFDRMMPESLPFWLKESLGWQRELMQSWQKNWLMLWGGTREEDPEQQLWMVDAGNYKLQANQSGNRDTSHTDSTALLPGSLGIVQFTPENPLPFQLMPEVPLLVVSNYLCNLVSLYQYEPITGEFIPYTVFGMPGDLKQPQGLAVDPISNEILIADSGHNRISCWRITDEGIAEFVSAFGSEGTGPGEFRTPSDVTVDEQGNRYVTDQNNNRIQVFDAQGKWLYSFGQRGYSTDSDHFLLPTSIEHENGYLFISDLVNRAIKVFDIEGQFATSFAGFGADSSRGQLWMPYLMHVRDNRIYLADCTLNRVNIYQFDPAAITKSQPVKASQKRPNPQSEVFEQAMAHRMSVNKTTSSETASQLHQQLQQAVEQFRSHLEHDPSQAVNQLRAHHKDHARQMNGQRLSYPHA